MRADTLVVYAHTAPEGSKGIMQACLDTVIPCVRERQQFGQPSGAFQLVQAKVTYIYVALQSARARRHQRSSADAYRAGVDRHAIARSVHRRGGCIL